MVKDLGPIMRRAVCNNCGHKLEYENSDIKDEIKFDVFDAKTTRFYIECPNCEHTVTIELRVT